jgi:hypothetical protein
MSGLRSDRYATDMGELNYFGAADHIASADYSLWLRGDSLLSTTPRLLGRDLNMNQHIHRIVRAVVAAACMATLGMALITTAAPSANQDQNAQNQSTSSSSGTGDSDQGDDLDNQSSKTPPLTGDANNPPGLHNSLMNLEAPKVKTASYSTGHDARHCYGLDGSEDVPGHNKFQHPCQAKHNSVGKGDAQFFGHSV